MKRSSHRSERVFVIRIWEERTGEGSPQARASITNAISGERAYVHGARALDALIKRLERGTSGK